MKNLKTSFTISGKTLKSLDRLVGKGGNRSAFVEAALNAAIEQRERELRGVESSTGSAGATPSRSDRACTSW
jgi:metal-responsive CopG/Arc/MetJ family transcriptional regulator